MVLIAEKKKLVAELAKERKRSATLEKTVETFKLNERSFRVKFLKIQAAFDEANECERTMNQVCLPPIVCC